MRQAVLYPMRWEEWANPIAQFKLNLEDSDRSTQKIDEPVSLGIKEINSLTIPNGANGGVPADLECN
jgi:hypothetical protein